MPDFGFRMWGRPRAPLARSIQVLIFPVQSGYWRFRGVDLTIFSNVGSHLARLGGYGLRGPPRAKLAKVARKTKRIYRAVTGGRWGRAECASARRRRDRASDGSQEVGAPGSWRAWTTVSRADWGLAPGASLLRGGGVGQMAGCVGQSSVFNHSLARGWHGLRTSLGACC
jgi:hypothetical protein